MSELMNARSANGDFRWQLLTTVSAMALLASACGSNSAAAADKDENRPTVWIELGGQMSHISGQGDSFPVGFLVANPGSPVLQPTTPLQAQRPLPFNFGEEGKISLQPTGSNWVFSASVNYGRSNNSKRVDHQTNKTFVAKYQSGVPQGNRHGTADFAETQVRHQESHTVLDFSAGKDVGLGMFGAHASSVLSLGVRFAQFSSRATFDVRARPDLGFKLKYQSSPPYALRAKFPHFHTYHDTGNASRGFHGLGPSLSWNGSSPFAGSPQDGEVTFDWGANVALLFGKQKTVVQHQEAGNYAPVYFSFQGDAYTLVYQHAGGHKTDRSIIVPNVGGFAGASYRIEDFKLSVGYRADFFFGAIDGGIDSRKSETLGFYGPFATISIGLGG